MIITVSVDTTTIAIDVVTIIEASAKKRKRMFTLTLRKKLLTVQFLTLTNMGTNFSGTDSNGSRKPNGNSQALSMILSKKRWTKKCKRSLV